MNLKTAMGMLKNTQGIVSLLLFIACLLAAQQVTAQQDIVSKLRQCRSISDATQRLQCYDDLVAVNSFSEDSVAAESDPTADAATPAVAGTQPESARRSTTESPDSMVMSRQQLQQEQQKLAAERRALEQEKQTLKQQQQALAQAQAEEPQQAETDAASPQPVLSAEQQLDAFGAEQVSSRLRKSRQADKEQSLDRIRARVVTVRGDRRRGYILVLDNGQVWSQRGTRYIDFLSDEKMEVEIERNSMNGYRLNQPATNRRIFVERIR